MAQLYDCFAEGGLTPLADIHRMIEALQPLVTQSETVKLGADIYASHAGRLFAENIIAPNHLPHFANAAVDGYAFSSDILRGAQAETKLEIIALIEAGDCKNYRLLSGQGAMIFTGAPMPENADTVLMYEDAIHEHGQSFETLTQKIRAGGKAFVTIPTGDKGIKPKDNYRPAGDDVLQGTQIIARGTRLDPHNLALCAGLGIKEIPLLAKLKIALLSTGDELIEPDSNAPLARGQIYDMNRPQLKGLLNLYGVEIHDYGIIADNHASLSKALNHAAANCDVILTSGAMSQGGRDYIRILLEAKGQIKFITAAIKPGRPVGVGAWQGVPLIGLPGNPVAAFTVFIMIALPILQKLQGAEMRLPQSFPALIDFDFKKRSLRVEYVRVKISGYDKATNLPILSPYGKKGAGVMSSLVGADGFAQFASEATDISAGSRVDYLPFHQFFLF